MSDYLFDGEGPPDPEVAKLERLLHGARYRRPPPPLRRPRGRVLAASAVVVALAAVVAAVFWFRRPDDDVWAVQSLAGTPTCGARPCVGLGVGDALVTDPASRARVSIGTIGTLDVEPGTTIERRPDTEKERLALVAGTVSARVVAPPRLLIIETASAHAVDLGCAYTLTVDARGAGRLQVTSGWVALESATGAVIVPRDAEAALHAGSAPGTPHFSDAGDPLRRALALVDAGLAAGTVDRPALDQVLAAARLRDTLSLYNLLARLPAPERADVLGRMLALGAPLASDVTRPELLAADPEALERWRHTLSSIWL